VSQRLHRASSGTPGPRKTLSYVRFSCLASGIHSPTPPPGVALAGFCSFPPVPHEVHIHIARLVPEHASARVSRSNPMLTGVFFALAARYLGSISKVGGPVLSTANWGFGLQVYNSLIHYCNRPTTFSPTWTDLCWRLPSHVSLFRSVVHHLPFICHGSWPGWSLAARLLACWLFIEVPCVTRRTHSGQSN
jgi:hypothetical protein